jgi:general secretion pathway protein G
MNLRRRTYAGFTLIEMLVTVAIVGVMASVVLPMMELSVQRTKEQELRVALREIRGALDAYRVAVQEGRIASSSSLSGYPASLKILVEGVTDARSVDSKSRVYFLRRVPRDPFATESELPPDKQWGIRSYSSTADDPEEGEDVYDVYTRAAGVGMNGISYREW